MTFLKKKKGQTVIVVFVGKLGFPLLVEKPKQPICFGILASPLETSTETHLMLVLEFVLLFFFFFFFNKLNLLCLDCYWVLCKEYIWNTSIVWYFFFWWDSMIFLLHAFLSAHNNYPIIFTIDSQKKKKKIKMTCVQSYYIYISGNN